MTSYESKSNRSFKNPDKKANDEYLYLQREDDESSQEKQGFKATSTKIDTAMLLYFLLKVHLNEHITLHHYHV